MAKTEWSPNGTSYDRSKASITCAGAKCFGEGKSVACVAHSGRASALVSCAMGEHRFLIHHPG